MKDNILTGDLEGIEQEEITLNPNRQTSSENDNPAYQLLTTTWPYYCCLRWLHQQKERQLLIQGAKVWAASQICLALDKY